MRGFGYFEEFSNILTIFNGDIPTNAVIRKVANQLSSDLRLYRKEFLVYAQYDGKFLDILNFLKEKSPDNRISIDDQDIFDFWHLHCKGKDYRGYKTVFDHFVQFSRAYKEASAISSAGKGRQLGTDRERGEIDIADDHEARNQIHEWISPLSAFDHEDLNDIRFFKTASERKPMEKLMIYGLDALDLPLAFLRYETFGQVQTAITTDLQVGRGEASVNERVTCENVESYEDRLRCFNSILAHVYQLQASLLHVLLPVEEEMNVEASNIVSFSDAMTTANKSFSKMTRKGFSDDLLTNKEIKPALLEAADALTTISGILQKFAREMEQKGLIETALYNQFETDRIAFRSEFQAIYGKGQS